MHSRRRLLLKSSLAIMVASTLPKSVYAQFHDSNGLGDGDHNYGMRNGAQAGLQDYEIDYISMIKSIICYGLKFVPEVGSFLALLVNCFWPAQSTDVWAQVRQQVEALIKAKINDAVFSLLKSKLDGINAAMILLLAAIKAKDKEEIKRQFTSTNTVIAFAMLEFKNPDYALLLSPLFAMAAVIHITTLRIGLINGRKWGWSQNTYNEYVDIFNTTLADYVDHLNKVYDHYHEECVKKQPASHGIHRTGIYNYWVQYNQVNIQIRSDFIRILTNLDPLKYPEPPRNIEFEDVYSRAFGTADDWGPYQDSWAKEITTPYSQPLENISEIYLEFFAYIPRVVHVKYPAGKGPLLWGKDRVDSCDIIDPPDHGKETSTIKIPPSKHRFNIEAVGLNDSDHILNLFFIMDDKSRIGLWNNDTTHDRNPFTIVAFKGRFLSTLNMWTTSRYYNWTLACIIFGFSADFYREDDKLKELFYRAVLDLNDLPSSLIPGAITEELMNTRLGFQRRIDRAI